MNCDAEAPQPHRSMENDDDDFGGGFLPGALAQ